MLDRRVSDLMDWAFVGQMAAWVVATWFAANLGFVIGALRGDGLGALVTGIWGMIIGGLISIVVGLILFHL